MPDLTTNDAGVPHQSAMPDTLFHYTTASGLLGILNHAKIWATDLRFLNDSEELVYSQDVVAEAIRVMENPIDRPDHWAHQLGEAAVETFTRYQGYVLDELQSGEFGVYVTCFCESGNLLNQWRGYGNQHGYAIEVRTSALEEVLQGVGATTGASGLFKVGYGQDAAAVAASAAVEAVAQFNLNHPGVKAEFKALEVAAKLATVKHPAFSEEEEWRLLTVFHDYRGDGFGLHHIETMFRATPMAVVPYVEFPLPLDAIVSVKVGPGDSSGVREIGVRRLLKALRCTAIVSRSDVPFRF